jgi:hypothetical protein
MEQVKFPILATRVRYPSHAAASHWHRQRRSPDHSSHEPQPGGDSHAGFKLSLPFTCTLPDQKMDVVIDDVYHAHALPNSELEPSSGTAKTLMIDKRLIVP